MRIDRWWKLLLLVVAAAVVAAACGSGTGSNDSTVPTASDTAATATSAQPTTTAAAPGTTAPPTSTTTAAVSPATEVTSDDGLATLDVPAGAVPAGTAISVTAVAPPPETVGEDFDVYAYDLQPSGLVFAEPVSLTLRLDAREEGATPIAAAVLRGDDGAVSLLAATTEVRGADLAVTMDVEHFSEVDVAVSRTGWRVIPDLLLIPVGYRRSAILSKSSGEAFLDEFHLGLYDIHEAIVLPAAEGDITVELSEADANSVDLVFSAEVSCLRETETAIEEAYRVEVSDHSMYAAIVALLGFPPDDVKGFEFVAYGGVDCLEDGPWLIADPWGDQTSSCDPTESGLAVPIPAMDVMAFESLGDGMFVVTVFGNAREFFETAESASFLVRLEFEDGKIIEFGYERHDGDVYTFSHDDGLVVAEVEFIDDATLKLTVTGVEIPPGTKFTVTSFALDEDFACDLTATGETR